MVAIAGVSSTALRPLLLRVLFPQVIGNLGLVRLALDTVAKGLLASPIPNSPGYARVSRSTSKWNHGRHGDRGIYSNSTPSIVCALKKGGQSWIWCSRF